MRSRGFEERGYARQLDRAVAIGYGTDGHQAFWISRAPDSAADREMHVAFTASDSDAVKAFYERPVELGSGSLHVPRLRPEYHERYYGGARPH